MVLAVEFDFLIGVFPTDNSRGFGHLHLDEFHHYLVVVKLSWYFESLLVKWAFQHPGLQIQLL